MANRTWTNDGGTALSAGNLNAMESDIATALGVPDAALATRVVTGATKAALDAAYPSIVALAPAPSGGNDTTMLNAFLAANAGKIVALRNGATYLATSSLVVPANTTLNLNRATVNCSTMAAGTALAQRYGIRSDGSLGSQVPVTASLAKWGRVMTGIASTAGFAVGDMVLISNDEGSVPGIDLNTRDKAELNNVASIDSGTSLTLTHGAVFDYGTAGLTIRKVNPVDKVTITNGTIIMGGVGSAHNGVQIQYGRDALIERVHVVGAEDCGIGLRAVLSGDIVKCTSRDATSSATLGATGYGAAVWDASRLVRVDSNYFENNRHHVAGGGIWPPAFVTVSNNAGRKSLSASYDCHEPCQHWTFYKNTAEVGTHGIFVRGQYTTLEGNIVSDISQEAYAVHAYNSVTEQRGTRLLFNEAYHCGYGISVGKASGETVEYVSYNIEVIGNKLNDSGTNPIRIRMFDGCKVSNNTIVGGTAAAILLEGVDATTRSKNLTLDGNDVRNAGTHGVHIRFVDEIQGTGGHILNAGQNGYYVESCNGTNLSPKVTASSQYGIQYSGGARHVLSNPHVSGGLGATYDAVRASGLSSLNIVGGYLASPRYAVFTTTTPKLGVTGTHVSDTVHGTKVNQDAGAGYVSAGLL